MQTLCSFALALCLVGTAAPALGADYVPVSDAAIGAIRLVPENAAEVTAPCDSRLAALTSLRARVEAMALSTEPLTLLAAYDDLYNLANPTPLEEETIKDKHPDAATRTDEPRLGKKCGRKCSYTGSPSNATKNKMKQ